MAAGPQAPDRPRLSVRRKWHGWRSRAGLRRQFAEPSPLRRRRPIRSALPGVWKPRIMRWGAMLNRGIRGAALGAAIAIAAAAFGAVAPANAQVTVSEADEIRAGEL